MTTSIAKATSRGQITLPQAWRKKFKTDQYLIKAGDFKLEITPVGDEELEWASAETIFNADRDNNGKGIEVGEFIRLLESMRKNGQNTKTTRKSTRKR